MYTFSLLSTYHNILEYKKTWLMHWSCPTLKTDKNKCVRSATDKKYLSPSHSECHSVRTVKIAISNISYRYTQTVCYSLFKFSNACTLSTKEISQGPEGASIKNEVKERERSGSHSPSTIN